MSKEMSIKNSVNFQTSKNLKIFYHNMIAFICFKYYHSNMLTFSEQFIKQNVCSVVISSGR